MAPRSSFKKGDSRINRKGRPVGSKNRVTLLTNAQRMAIVTKGELTPLQFLQSVAMDETQDIETRRKAAADVAPYLHRKKPIAVDGGEGQPITVLSAEKLAAMSEKDLEAMNAALIKLGVGSGEDS